jgi:phosphatidate cytidylyltransferase
VLSLLAGMAMFEMLSVLGYHKKPLVCIPAYLAAVVFPIASYVYFYIEGKESASQRQFILYLSYVLFVYLLYLFGVSIFSKGKIRYADVSAIFTASTYIAVSFTALSVIRYMSDYGMCYVPLVFIVSWASDAGGYFVGTFLGKHKLIPEVSPKKTVEGSLGGIVASVLITLLYGLVIELHIIPFFPPLTSNYLVLALSGFALSFVSQLGDLLASLIKREHGIKDYGNIFPGHGGVVDRFDSVMSVALILMIICSVAPPFFA